MAPLVLLSWLGLVLMCTFTTVKWSRRVWELRKELPLRIKVTAGIMAGCAMFGALGTVIGVAKGFGLLGWEGGDPSQRARTVGEGISMAMNCTAIGFLAWVPSVLALVWMMRQIGGAERKS